MDFGPSSEILDLSVYHYLKGPFKGQGDK